MDYAVAEKTMRTRKAATIGADRFVCDRSTILLGRLLGALLATGLLAMLGLLAARATESSAIGILCADLIFLLTVAGWSAVAGRR